MTLIAIDVLQDPDAATVEKAQATNARLREDYPDGFALDANHAPHITILQRFMRTTDLDEVANALWPKCCVYLANPNLYGILYAALYPTLEVRHAAAAPFH